MQTQLKKAFNKKGYNCGGSTLKIVSWYAVSTIFFKSGLLPFSSILVVILRLFGAKIGNDVRIKPGVYIRYPWNLTVGDHSWLADCYIENLDSVIIGENACISQQAMLLTGNHNYKAADFELYIKPIVLNDGVWIGAKAIVCPGVTANSHAMLTAGSVANKDLDPYFIYQGNPAFKVRSREISHLIL
jgi:putative colanic acid biosynthesis acetyltransferase WcaF